MAQNLQTEPVVEIAEERTDFYVYYYLRSKDSANGGAGTPYYVGKGTGRRIAEKHGTTPVPKNADCRVMIAEGLTETVAHQLEKLHIKFWGRTDSGTGILRNLTDGGEGVSGWIPTDETRQKLSATQKEVQNRPDVKSRQSAAQKEAQNRPDVKARNSAAQKEAQNRPDVKARKSAAAKEAQNRPDVKARKSATNNRPDVKARKSATNNRPDVKARRSAAAKEAMNRPDVKARQSAAAKEACSRPDVKARKSAAQKEANSRPDVKARQSAAQKAFNNDPKNHKTCEHCQQTVKPNVYGLNHSNRCKHKPQEQKQDTFLDFFTW